MYKSLKVILFILFVSGFSYAKSITYSANFMGLSAGSIKVNINSKDDIECYGKTNGIFSIFYSYSFKFVKKGDIYTLEEDKSGKKKIYNTDAVLKEKSWIPIFVNMLNNPNYNVGSSMSIGNIKAITEANVQNQIYFFKIEHSYTKRVVLWYVKDHEFPKLIRIETKSGTINLEKE